MKHEDVSSVSDDDPDGIGDGSSPAAQSAVGGTEDVSSLLRRLDVRSLARRLASARARELSVRTRRILLGFSVLLFLAFAVWSWQQRPAIEGGISWRPMIAAMVLTPLIFGFKALEYDAAARLLGHRPSSRTSLEVAVLSSAANLLPLPGSVVVTVHSLSAVGSTYARGAVATASVGIAWVGVTGICGGAALIYAGTLWGGLLAFFIGAASCVAAWRLAASCRPDRPLRVMFRVVIIELAFVLGTAAQYWLVLRAIRVPADITQTVALTMAASVATALSIFPSGLGIREGVTAAISPLVKLPAAAGVLMSVVTRLMWLFVVAVIALVLQLGWRRSGHVARAGPLVAREDRTRGTRLQFGSGSYVDERGS